ncbi:hypothetical protein RQP46_004148 [Phenoliferia psychrophenolica]
MKIITWNVNGIKTLLQYHPWNVHKTYEAILDELGADITCVQETKITRAQTDTLLACMPAYDSFFSFYRRTPPKGIHGTAIFTKRSSLVPLRAEEGIGASLLPVDVQPADRIGGYPQSSEVDLTPAEMKDLDTEGRTTVVDCGLFVLINLYCPNTTNEDRLVFKNNFNAMVDRRVRSLIKAGRQVIVVGDLNISVSPLDSAESGLRPKDSEGNLESWIAHPPRRWLHDFVGPDGPMIDITRRLHPTRKKMFTCWETKIDARPSNYGTRLDYILITPSLLPWIRDADILPSIMGSDHCPVFVDFYDSITLPDRGEVDLWSEMNPGRIRGDGGEQQPPPPPASAARFYDEFSGRQKKISNFFGKKGEAPLPPPPPPPKPTTKTTKRDEPVASDSKLAPPPPPPSTTTSTVKKSTSVKGKEKAVVPPLPPPVPVPGEQQSISSFFKPPPKPAAPLKKKKKKSSTTTSSSTSTSKPEPSASAPQASTSTLSSSLPPPTTTQDDDPQPPFDPRDFLAPSGSAPEAAAAWSTLFTPKALPKCDGHDEPSKLWTVNKPGINKGRRFYLCSRPVGPGYDKGQAKLHVNKEWRCNFFEWETNVRRPASGEPPAKKQKT